MKVFFIIIIRYSQNNRQHCNNLYLYVNHLFASKNI
jgi:hypothetical protein